MIIEFNLSGKVYKVDLSQPLDISIPLKQGDDNPNCYHADPVSFEVIRSGDFVGSVAEGGSVNYLKLSMTPHGNGTHTESLGHITKEPRAIKDSLKEFHFLAQLKTVTPQEYNGDQVISKEQLSGFSINEDVRAMVIRTQPNGREKMTRKYSGTNPPYLDPAVTNYLADIGVLHLLIDLPSVDKEEDGGALAAHKAFWNYPDHPRSDATITELIYVPDEITDGLYLLNLQIISLDMDASPSKPVLYRIL